MHEAHAYGTQDPMHCFGTMESLAHTSASIGQLVESQPTTAF